MFVTTLSSFLTPFMGSAINIALPEMGKELNMNTLALGWVSTSYLLAAAVFLLPFGRLSDKYGRKQFYMLGIIFFILSAFVSAIARTETVLLISRFVNGAGGAMVYATAIAILTSAYPKSDRGRVLGINVAAVYLGLSLGPTLGGYMTSILGWRSIFYLVSILSLITLPIVAIKIDNDKKRGDPTPFDIWGSLFYGLGLASVIYGFPEITSTRGVIFLISGLALLWVFIRIEHKVADPLLQFNVFTGNQVFIFSNLAAFINYSATFALVFLLSFYLQQVKNLSPGEAGLILMAQPVVMTVFSPLAGKLSDRIEPAIVASIGMGVTVVGLAAFAFLNAETGIVLIVVVQAFLGLGFALFSSPNTNAVMSSVEPQQYGIASATLGTMRMTGQTMSMTISMMVIALVMGKSGATAENTEGLLLSIRYSFIVFALLCIAGTFFSMKRGKLHNEAA